MTDIPRALDVDGAIACGLIGRLHITLNGQPVRGCDAYNLDEGWIERAVHDGNGHLIIEGDEYVYERVYGEIEVTLQPK